MRPSSPVSNKPLLGPGRTATPTGQRPASSHTPSGHPPQVPSDPLLKASGMPSYAVGSRTESPLMSSLHQPPSRSSLNGNGALGNTSSMSDRERHHMSPRLAPGLALPSKLSAAPMVDRR
jgi:hypothetical protein